MSLRSWGPATVAGASTDGRIGYGGGESVHRISAVDSSPGNDGACRWKATRSPKKTVGMSTWRSRAEVVAELMMDGGALGAALMGSHARGDAHPLSDVDIVGLGRGAADFREEDGVILSISWVEPEAAMASFTMPHELVMTVPGWRAALPLSDPNGRVAEVIAAARNWCWSADLDDKAREWLANEVTGYCEEVFGLVRSIESSDDYPAAVVRSVFALRCANLIAVRHGVLYDSEKHLWGLIADRQGGSWRRMQDAAFALDGESVGSSARAALQLFQMVVEESWPDLSAAQRVVVDHALREIERLSQ